MMKISFSGIPGSGKTSLTDETKKVLSLKYNVEVVDEISQKNPFDNGEKSGFKSQFLYLTTQINEENIKAIGSPEILLCDRCVLDQWIYWKKHISEKEMNDFLVEKTNILKNLYRYWIRTYDLLFFIRYDLKEYENRKNRNQYRTADKDYVKKIEQIFVETIKEDNLKVTEIWNNSSIDESAHKIIQVISENLA